MNEHTREQLELAYDEYVNKYGKEPYMLLVDAKLNSEIGVFGTDVKYYRGIPVVYIPHVLNNEVVFRWISYNECMEIYRSQTNSMRSYVTDLIFVKAITF